ncbi:uncharacterized protein TNCV_1753691 [Trichonephila clavipes]|nr:uncharacterized protein TNCV_1753691 [Trichonephila clavipes]
MGLANASINPTHNQIYYLHKCWRDANLGSSINPFDKLKEKVPFYESIGTTVKVHEDHLWAVLLVTPLMKRNHHLFSSKEIIFIDSTSSCEASSSTITILLSATKSWSFAAYSYDSCIPIYSELHQCVSVVENELSPMFWGTRLSRGLYE